MQVVLSALALTTVDGSHGVLRRQESFVKSLEFHQSLRVCNAFPMESPLDLYRGKTRLTGDSPMAYKSCRDFTEPMKSGDRLEFKIGDETAGTFSVSDLPNNDAVLLLIIHRHDTLSTAVSFESHVFANLANPQIAVIDTYKGKSAAHVSILNGKVANQSRTEELRYDSVVAVNPGIYEVELTGQHSEAKTKQQLVALGHENYVIFRAGVEAQVGTTFPQELVIFPASDAAKLKSSAEGLRVPSTFLALVSLMMLLLGH